LLVALPSMHAWYGLWIAPATACSGRWAAYAWWFGVLVFGCYLFDVIGGAGVPLWVAVSATALYLVGPAVAAIRMREPAAAAERSTRPGTQSER
jgi:hypothetical protein